MRDGLIYTDHLNEHPREAHVPTSDSEAELAIGEVNGALTPNEALVH